MKMKRLIYMIILLLVIGTASARLTEEALQAAIDEELGQKLICGNNVCQEGEQLTCPRDCSFSVGDMSCVIKDDGCSLPVIMIYIVLIVVLIRIYKKQTK